MDWRIIVCILINVTQITNCLTAEGSSQPTRTSNPSSYDTEDVWWMQSTRSVGKTMKDCLSVMSSKSSAPRRVQIRKQVAMLSSCLKHYTRKTLQLLLIKDVIPLTEGVDLVRINRSETKRTSRAEERGGEIGDASVAGWRNMLIDTLADIFDTHAVRISMHELQVADSNTETARRRKKDQSMMPLMMFGMVGLAMILVPMGFQFLAVLGGKALLLAKMALILSSIQGLKKVAHSNLNYGLYHSETAHTHPWYDRKAEDIEHIPEDIYYSHNPYTDQAVNYKRYTRI